MLCATLLASMAVTQTHAALGIQQATTKKVIDNYAETKYPPSVCTRDVWF
nr:hypothetical protein [Acinetobacter sp. YH12052]